MSNFDYLFDMRDEGYSPEEILEAATSGASPQEWADLAKQEAEMEGEIVNKPSRKSRRKSKNK